MTKQLIIAVVVAEIIALGNTVVAIAGPLSVGNRACLFLDDHFIDKQEGLKHSWHQGKLRPEVAIAETEPWENWPTLWGSCFYDPKYKVYRMYYQVTLYPSDAPGISFRDLLCYAESKDAKTWVKPKIGIVEHNGSKENNIVVAFAGPPCVMIDPKAKDNAGRLKMFTYFLKADPKYHDAHGVNMLQSEDGIHWNYGRPVEFPTWADPAVALPFNDLFPIYWDDIRKSYVGAFRTASTHAIGELFAKDGKTKNRRRAVGITWSDSPTKGWSPVQMALHPDDEDDKRATTFSKDPAKPEWAEMYVMAISTYGNHHLGLVSFYDVVDSKDCNGGGDLQLAYSNDGNTWRRPEPRTSAVEHNTDRPDLLPTFAQMNPPLDMGDEIWVFFSENNGTHGIMPFDKSDGRIRAAVWRKDGFASMDCAVRGTLITKPIVFDGQELLVNFNTQPGGEIRVAILDEQGQPIGQYDLGGCTTLTGDKVAHRVEWQPGWNLASFKGKPMRLLFELKKAQLWSFRFE